jgi:hypothetical protein
VAYQLQFEAAGINADKSFIHDNESFHVQWKAQNLGPDDTAQFVDHLVIIALPEGCPGDDSVQHQVVYDSANDGDPADFAEPVLPAGTIGPLMSPSVGPFPASSYRLTVTLDDGGASPFKQSSCIEVLATAATAEPPVSDTATEPGAG